MGIIEPKKYVSNYSVDAAGWTQVLYRILVEGMLTNSSYGGWSGWTGRCWWPDWKGKQGGSKVVL